MKYVLDASTAISALNDVGGVRSRLATVSEADVGIPIVAVAELTFGAYKSKRRQDNLARVAALRSTFATLPLTDGVVDLYGKTRAELESRGQPKSDFDLLIACTALELGAVLVTSDRGLLDRQIEGLQAENWLV